jgi:hypothetical protein
MRRSAKRVGIVLCGALLVALPGIVVFADSAKVRLVDGTALRGDVELVDREVIVRNAVGEVRLERARVEHIEWLEPAKDAQSEGMRRLFALADDDVAGHLDLAQWLLENGLPLAARRRCQHVLTLQPENERAKALIVTIASSAAPPAEPAPAADDAAEPADAEPRQRYKGVQPPPPLTERDIQRLKLAELRAQGPAEQLNVRFLNPRGQRRLEDVVLDDITEMRDPDPNWADAIRRGEPHEQLAAIARATGLKYADRIEVRGHPEAFATYRRQVLPHVARSCVRSGCHGGHTAHAFRFPTGPQTGDEFVYTSFAFLDRMNTAAGPMINRVLPDESALLRYLVPIEGKPGHSPVEDGQVRPVFRSERDPRFEAIIDWIASLRSPHPDYQLEYDFPDWLEALSVAEGAPAEAEGADEPNAP